MDNNKRYLQLLDEINDITVIDAHDHIIPEKERINKNIFYFFPHYVSFDIVSAGLDFNFMRNLVTADNYTDADLEIFFKNWEKTRNTTYSKSLLRGIKEIYGLGDLTLKNYKDLELAFNKTKVNGWYEKIYKKAKIEKSINQYCHENMDKQLDVDRKFFAPVVWFDFLISIFKTSDIERIEKETDVSIHNVDDLLKAIDKVFKEKIVEKKASAIKFGIAYTRSLEVKKQTKYDAEKCFNKLFDKSVVDVGHIGWVFEKGLSQREMIPLQDYLIHYVLELSESINIPIKIHSGLQEGYNFVTNSNPTLLLEVFNEYKRVRFDILHGGYPYSDEMVCICKVFPNVYLDISWIHIVTPTATKQLLHKLIEAVPSNKVFGYGGDYAIIEGAFGILIYTRENIAHVLYQKIEEGYFNKKEALTYAKKILYENPKEFFNI